MYIKIYFNNKPLFLCDNIDQLLHSLIHKEDTIFIDELNTHAIKTMIYEMQLKNINSGVFYHNNLEELKKAFYKKCKFIKAAGGFVLNEKNEMLFIYRHNKWDLPKGKFMKNESPEICAVREVQEETGLINLIAISYLTTTYHTYQEGTQLVLKETEWFRMKAVGKQNLVPQLEESITKIEWVKKNAIAELAQKSYPSIHDVIEAGLKIDA